MRPYITSYLLYYILEHQTWFNHLMMDFNL